MNLGSSNCPVGGSCPDSSFLGSNCARWPLSGW